MKKLLLPLVLIMLVAAGCLGVSPAKIQPTAYIDLISPRNAVCGQTVSFKGHGIDPDGTVGAYNWRSSIDGDLSTADSFSTSSLSPGTHSIWFKVQDNDGQWSNEVMGNVVVAVAGATKPVINSFTASPASISLGQSATLQWDVTGCTNVTIAPAIGAVSLNGNRLVSPDKTTTYTLTAVNEIGTSVATVQVIIGETPTTKVELYSIAAEDGQVRRDGTVSQEPLVGDTYSGVLIQAFFSFDISSIPQGATIKSASLELGTSGSFGEPFARLGKLNMYNCRYKQLSASDYVVGTLPGTLYSVSYLITEPISSNLMLNAIQETVDEGSNRFQLRFQFDKQQVYPGATPTTYMNLADYIAFSPERTKLTIEYQH